MSILDYINMHYYNLSSQSCWATYTKFCDETCNPFFAHSANVIVESEAALDTQKERVNIKSILPYI